MNMKNWINKIKQNKIKKAFPILSFPSIQLMDITVKDLIADSDLQAKGMKLIADKNRKVCKLITDRPVFAGVIGPFSLTGRLMDVTEAMINCYTESDMVHTILDKVTEFLINYINAYKNVGANGVVMAEPLAGML